MSEKNETAKTILQSILHSLRQASAFNQHELAAPRLILWPDENRLWSQVIGLLQSSYPALWVLGDYDPDRSIGPAVWLRYRLETYQGKDLPVFYLPGVGRAAFRSADGCPPAARHLFALQFQGQFWAQRNGRDWTPFAYLSAVDGGLGLDVAGDLAAKQALQESLPKLLALERSELQGHKLEAADFLALITIDPIRTLLKWMGSPEKTRKEMQSSGSEWSAFRTVCQDTYGFDPEKDGALTAAEKLSGSKNPWPQVWARYKEAPRNFPGVKELLASVKPANLLTMVSEFSPKGNQEQEKKLGEALLALASATPKKALAKIKALAADHLPRAEWVWAELEESPLARAMVPMLALAEAVETAGSPTGFPDLADYYVRQGWKADCAVWQALHATRTLPHATEVVSVAIRAIYLPWLEKMSLLVQAQSAQYPTAGPQHGRPLTAETGKVFLFADGLRMDLAKVLEERLFSTGKTVLLDTAWAPLPTVTATAKPAWQPFADKLGGPLEGTAFDPRDQNKNKPLQPARFRQLLAEQGIYYLEASQTGSPGECAWTEIGSIDSSGHTEGARLAWRLEEELVGLQRRIAELLEAGWTKVQVVTDHGWLLLPGGLPKEDLPKHLTDSLWGRCAIPAPGAQHGYPMTSWFWDPAEAVVLAPGISCFQSGREYAHGGLTLQEAFIPSLTVCARPGKGSIHLKDWKWSGLRLSLTLEHADGLAADLRSKAADSSSSLTTKPVVVKEKQARLLVPDDEAQGKAAFLVVLDADGQPIFKHPIVIGENEQG